MKIQKKFIVKMISALCATCAIASIAQPVVSANPPKKLLGKKTKLQKEDESQNDDPAEKEQIKNLIKDLKNAYKIEDIKEKSEKITQTIKDLFDIHDFCNMEPEIAQAVSFAIRKHCFNQIVIYYDYRCQMVENVLINFNDTSMQIKDILDKCANNNNAQKFVAKAVKNWICQSFDNSKTYDQNVSDRLKFQRGEALDKEYARLNPFSRDKIWEDREFWINLNYEDFCFYMSEKKNKDFELFRAESAKNFNKMLKKSKR